MYTLYVICSGEKNIRLRVSRKVNHISDFMGRYRSIQVENEVNMMYTWSKTYSYAKDIPRGIFEVWFSDLYGYWRTRLFSVLVTLKDKVVLRFW
jgi:hypothetical protein